MKLPTTVILAGILSVWGTLTCVGEPIPDAAGFVLAITGTWKIEGMESQLRKGETIPAQRRVHMYPGGSTIPSITIVRLDGRPAIIRTCQQPVDCATPIELDVQGEVPSSFEKIRSVITRLFHDDKDNRYVIPLSRGEPTLREAVLLLNNDPVDFSQVLDGVAVDRYIVRLELLRGISSPQEAGVATPRQSSFDWNPQVPKPVTIGQLMPGLYRVKLLRPLASGYGPIGIEAWVLLSEASVYAERQAAFSRLEEFTTRWGKQVARTAVRSFLRAGLEELVAVKQEEASPNE